MMAGQVERGIHNSRGAITNRVFILMFIYDGVLNKRKVLYTRIDRRRKSRVGVEAIKLCESDHTEHNKTQGIIL